MSPGGAVVVASEETIQVLLLDSQQLLFGSFPSVLLHVRQRVALRHTPMQNARLWGVKYCRGPAGTGLIGCLRSGNL